MATVNWTAEAVESLRDIHRYIARDRPETADRTIGSILDKAASIAACPGLGQAYAFIDERDVSVLTYGHFRIAYCLSPASGGDHVTILGVFHGLIFLPLK